MSETMTATITETMSRWAAELSYDQLSDEAIYQAKRYLLDSIGCAMGGYGQHDVRIALEVLDETAAPGKATVFGSGKKLNAQSAALANALAVRCMDYNDIYWKQDPSHPAARKRSSASCSGTSSRCASARRLFRASASVAGITRR